MKNLLLPITAMLLNQSQGGMYFAKRVRDMAGPYSSYRIRNRPDSKAPVLDAPKM